MRIFTDNFMGVLLSRASPDSSYVARIWRGTLKWVLNWERVRVVWFCSERKIKSRYFLLLYQ